MSWTCCIGVLEKCLPRNDISHELGPYIQEANAHQDQAHRRNEVILPPKKPVFVYASVCSLRRLESDFREKLISAIEVYERTIRHRLKTFHGYEVSYDYHRFLLAFNSVYDAAKFCMCSQIQLLFAGWNKSFVSSAPEVGEEKSKDDKLLFRGLRVRMGIHVGNKIEIVFGNEKGIKDVNYIGEDVELAKAVGVSAHGGQIVVSEYAWLTIKEQLTQLGSPIVEDLGNHKITQKVSMQLIQLLPSEIQDRRFPAIMSISQNAPGMRDAPAANEKVTMVFTYIVGVRQLILSNALMTVQRIELFCKHARRLLRKHNGYECQELQGEFMLAFKTPEDAVMWCGEVQIEVKKMNSRWNNDSKKEDISPFLISMGIETGIPVSVSPHKTSGRADYFGNIVNHTARIGKAANGGQILVGWEAFVEMAGPRMDGIVQAEENDKFPKADIASSVFEYVFCNLGTYSFKGISKPTLILEANLVGKRHKDTLQTFPPIKAPLVMDPNKVDKHPLLYFTSIRGTFAEYKPIILQGNMPYDLRESVAAASIREKEKFQQQSFYGNYCALPSAQISSMMKNDDLMHDNVNRVLSKNSNAYGAVQSPLSIRNGSMTRI